MTAPSTRGSAFFKRESVLVYFALVFVISWGGTVLVLGPDRFPPSAEQFENLGALFYSATLAGPCLAGVLMTVIVDGRQGLRELLTRLRRWQVGWSWYAFALLPALLMVASTVLLSLVSADLRPAFIDSTDKSTIVLSAIGPSLLAGIFEEIGWTGFAVPHLRSRHSILVTGLMIGAVWGAWHAPLFWQDDTLSGALALSILLTQLFSWLPPFRVLLVWIHERTQSLPTVMLTHALVSFISITLAPEGLAGPRLLTKVLVSAATMWLLLAAIGLATRRQVVRQPLQPSIG